MSPLDVVLLIVIAGTCGLVGGAAPLLYRRIRCRHTAATPPAMPNRSDALDPQLETRLAQLSAEWAARNGQPAAAPLAAGYLMDAFRDLQRRLGGQR